MSAYGRPWMARVMHLNYDRNVPVASLEDEYSPGNYYVEVGTRYSSSGNTGSYKLSLKRM